MYSTQSNTAGELRGFSVGIEIYLVVCVVEIDVISLWGIGIDLISV